MTITLNEMISLLVENDPIDVYNELYKSNEEFRGFIERNKDKTADESLQDSLDNMIRERMSHASWCVAFYFINN